MKMFNVEITVQKRGEDGFNVFIEQDEENTICLSVEQIQTVIDELQRIVNETRK